MAIIDGRGGRGTRGSGMAGEAGFHNGTLPAGSLTRRSLLAGGLGLALPPSLLGPAAAAPASARVPFGGAIQAEHFGADPLYAQAFLDRCDIILPMNELKFSLVRPRREAFDFAPADRLVDFALSNGKASRGHTHVWWDGLPDWLLAISSPLEAERELVAQIETVMDRYRGRLASWDVVNEVIAHEPLPSAALRDSYWLRTLGPRHIPLAFGAAAAADPGAKLVLNDYDLEFAGPRYDRRRAVALSIVRQLQDAGIRVDGVGIQAHLYAEMKVDVAALAAFGETLKRLGVALLVTELDIIDWNIAGGPAEQDAAALRIVGDLLDGVFAVGPPAAVIAWGITDRYSWIPDVMPRRDGKPCRPLPLDAEFRPKPWYDLIRRRLAAPA